MHRSPAGCSSNRSSGTTLMAVSLIFDRKVLRRGRNVTPGRFRTRVITEGVTPSLHVEYKTTRIKQYHKEGRALRTETTINDTWDFKIGRRLTNLPALREIGFHANRRLLGIQRLSHDPIDGTQALHTVTDPVVTSNGTRVPGLRLGQQRSHALLAALPIFRLQPDGFSNRDLRPLIAQLRGLVPDDITTGHLRPAPITPPRPDPADTAHPSLPRHGHRPSVGDVPVGCPRSAATHRPGRPRSTNPDPTPRSQHGLSSSHL